MCILEGAIQEILDFEANSFVGSEFKNWTSNSFHKENFFPITCFSSKKVALKLKKYLIAPFCAYNGQAVNEQALILIVEPKSS